MHAYIVAPTKKCIPPTTFEGLFIWGHWKMRSRTNFPPAGYYNHFWQETADTILDTWSMLQSGPLRCDIRPAVIALCRRYVSSKLSLLCDLWLFVWRCSTAAVNFYNPGFLRRAWFNKKKTLKISRKTIPYKNRPYRILYQPRFLRLTPVYNNKKIKGLKVYLVWTSPTNLSLEIF